MPTNARQAGADEGAVNNTPKNGGVEEVAMLVEDIEEGVDAATLEQRYRRDLASRIDRLGVETVADATDIDAERLERVDDPGTPLTLQEVTAILAVDSDRSAEAIMQDVRDHLMLEMSSAVVDVDALAVKLDGDLEPRDYQQMIEGRMEMPLTVYARVYRYVQSENPF